MVCLTFTSDVPISVKHELFGLVELSDENKSVILEIAMKSSEFSLLKIPAVLTNGELLDLSNLLNFTELASTTGAPLTVSVDRPIAPAFDYRENGFLHIKCTVLPGSAPKNLDFFVSLTLENDQETIGETRLKVPLPEPAKNQPATATAEIPMYIGRSFFSLPKTTELKLIASYEFVIPAAPEKLTQPQKEKWVIEAQKELSKLSSKQFDSNFLISELSESYLFSFDPSSLSISCIHIPTLNSPLMPTAPPNAKETAKRKFTRRGTSVIQNENLSIYVNDMYKHLSSPTEHPLPEFPKIKNLCIEDFPAIDKRIASLVQSLYNGDDIIPASDIDLYALKQDSHKLLSLAEELEFLTEIDRSESYYVSAYESDQDNNLIKLIGFLYRNSKPFNKEIIFLYSDIGINEEIAFYMIMSLFERGLVDDAKKFAIDCMVYLGKESAMEKSAYWLLLIFLEFAGDDGDKFIAEKYVALMVKELQGEAGEGEIVWSDHKKVKDMMRLPGRMVELFLVKHGNFLDFVRNQLEMKGDAARSGKEMLIWMILSGEKLEKIKESIPVESVDLQEFVMSYEKTVHPAPTVWDLLQEGTDFLERDAEKAKQMFTQSLKMRPTAFAHYHLAKLSHEDGNATKISHLEAAIQIDSASSVLWLELCLAVSTVTSHGDTKALFHALHNFVKRFDRNSSLGDKAKLNENDLVDFVMELIRLNLCKEAELIVSMGIDHFGPSYSLQTALGDSLNGQRRFVDALHAYEKAVSLINPPDKKKLTFLQSKCTPICSKLKNRDETALMHASFRPKDANKPAAVKS
jgi:tetratricopeptide (TPR) repeat protein